MSKYKIGDADRRKNTVPDTQGTSWRTWTGHLLSSKTQDKRGYTWTTNEEMTGTLCSCTELSRARCRRFVTFYKSALEILLLTYFFTYCMSSKTTQRTNRRLTYGSNKWNRIRFVNVTVYSADLWPLSVTQMKKLETVHHKFQHRLLGISWRTKWKMMISERKRARHNSKNED